MQKAFDLIKEKCMHDKRVGRRSFEAFCEIVNQVAEEYKKFGNSEQSEVCEWKEVDKDLFKRGCINGRRYLELEREFIESLTYCPYCGKKIKVIQPKGK